MMRTRSQHPSSICLPRRLLLLLLLLLLSTPSLAVTFILTVPATEEECYMMRVPFQSTINGNYNVLEDHLSSDQVSVVLLDEKGKTLYRSKYGRDHGSFLVQQVETKRFTICVQNAIRQKSRGRRPDDEPRNIGLSVNIDPPSKEQFDEKTESLLTYSRNVFSAVSDLAGHFSFRKMREVKHREIVELIFGELLWWTVGQALFVVTVALAQVFYLRHTVNKTIV